MNKSTIFKHLLEDKKGVQNDGANTSDKWFSLFKDRSYIGRLILIDLNQKRDSKYKITDFQTGKKKETRGFYLKDGNKNVGLLSQLYGGTGLFTLINRFNVLGNDGDSIDVVQYNSEDEWKDIKKVKKDFFDDELSAQDVYEVVNSIKSVLYNVLDYVEAEGYDLTPFIDEKTNADLFQGSNEQIEYIGAMTWALSFFVSARNASRKGLINFSSARERDEEKSAQQVAEINNRILKQIKLIINFFLDNVIKENGESVGWGYANGCIEPSLFFTYSVIEAYNDFEDNVLLSDTKDRELLDYLHQGIKNEEDYPEVRYRKLCEDLGDRTWRIYKDYMKDNFFSDKYDGQANIVTKEDILNSGRSSALFNNIYIIFIMFYSRVNERYEEAVNTMTRSLQFVQNFYDDLKAVGNDGIVDMHIIAFNQKNSLVKDFNKYLKDVSVQASSLLPMLVKANNLIASWILKYPQQSMSKMFEEMINNMLDGCWLWEDPKFDLLSTERYIEAIADFFDYYDVYERTYVQEAQDREAEAQAVQAQIKLQVQNRLEDAIAEEQEKIASSVRKEIEDNVRSQYTVENALNDLIDKKINEKVNELVIDKMCDLFAAATKYNKADDKSAVSLTKEQAQFKKILDKYVESFIFDDNGLSTVSDELGASEDIIRRETLRDISDFRIAYHRFIAKHGVQKGDKLKLADVFRLITKKDD